ncbi:MAG: hypothetical protein K1X47_11635 [Cyclobacteriaceae bacterium]|nr:hypothetical protein [Cyclobacteriaceae bacterium]
MKKQRIVLASVLKPVDDVRMGAKLARTLQEAGSYEVIVCGFPALGASPLPYQTVVHGPYGRLNWRRWFASWLFLFQCWRLNPEVLIVTTHELLWAGALLRKLRGLRLVYDVQENYYLNIRYAGTFPPVVGRVVAWWVRFAESFFSASVDHFLLAESIYDPQLRFFRHRFTVLENKVASAEPPPRQPGPGCQLLFSGTLAESTGVFRAIALTRALHEKDPSVTLLIAGHAAHEPTLLRLRHEIRGCSYIRLMGGDKPLAHSEIETAIRQSQAGLICYPHRPHTAGKVPTKLYEYLHARIPIITESRWHWVAEHSHAQPFVLTDFDKPDARQILARLQEPFYTTAPAHLTWKEQAPAFLRAIAGLTPEK